jgi:ribosomal protein S26
VDLLDIFEICQCNKGLMVNLVFIVDSLIIYDLYEWHLILESIITLMFIPKLTKRKYCQSCVVFIHPSRIQRLVRIEF